MHSLKAVVKRARLFFEILKGGVGLMAVVYVTLIVAGRKTFADVPAVLRDAVRDDLEAMGLGELAG